MQSNHLFTKKIEEQLHDLSLLLTEFQYLCNSPRRELRKINEFKQIITNFFNSTHADELVSVFRFYLTVQLKILKTSITHHFFQST